MWALTGSLVTVAGWPGVRVEALMADVEVPTPRVLAPTLIKILADLTLVGVPLPEAVGANDVEWLVWAADGAAAGSRLVGHDRAVWVVLRQCWQRGGLCPPSECRVIEAGVAHRPIQVVTD